MLLLLLACDPEKSPGGGDPADTSCESFLGYPDADADGWGGQAESVCELPAGWLLEGGDCDDTNAAANPGGTEVCDDADADEDCDGLADDADDGATGQTEGYADADGDGYGDPDASGTWCDGAPSEDATDCDDTLATVNPGAEETCDGIDDDCDGETDESDAIDAQTWHPDEDGDGYGDASSAETACEAGAWLADASDCDDGDATIHPGAEETCNDDDDDCDGEVDEDATDAHTWYTDADGDGYGDADTTVVSCDRETGTTADDSDCDDGDITVHPNAAEACDLWDTDEDCDGLADDDDTSVTGTTTWYDDDDGDGYGDPDAWEEACDAPSATTSDATDCDDDDGGTNPGASEICDAAETDEDCDGLVDADDPSVSARSMTTGYLDDDGDGYGTTADQVSDCELPPGYVATDGDCDDADASVSPAGSEVCDGDDVDEDCDGLADDDDGSVSASGMSTWYLDSDADGYGTSSGTTTACDAPSGYGEGTDDCDDADASVNPGETEVCGDAIDQDCDGVTDCDTDVGDADRAFTGASSSTYFGYSVASAGDQDGDGVDDIVFGTNLSSSADVTYVVNGGGAGALAAGSADAIFTNVTTSSGGGGGGCCGGGGPGCGPGPGPGPGGGCGGGGVSTTTAAGTSVAGIGDVDSDGYDDFAIGGDGDSTEGIVYILLGPQSGTSSLSSAWANWSGSTSADEAGEVEPAGDVSGDGRADVLVGAQGYSSGTGAAYLVTSYSSGTSSTASIATATFTGESGSDYLRPSGGTGDLDGDGYDDVLLGAYGDDDAGADAGAVYIFLGPQSGSMSASSADHKLTGQASGDYAGEVTSIGDLDGDGNGDLVVGASQYDIYGATYVLDGPFTTAWSLATADARIDGVRAVGPAALDAGGDVDPDGYDDLLLGYPADNTIGGYSGAGALFHGPVSGTLGEDDADWFITGDTAGAWAGFDVAFIGTQDGTSGDDVLLAAPYTSPSGAVYLFYGDQI